MQKWGHVAVVGETITFLLVTLLAKQLQVAQLRLATLGFGNDMVFG